MASLCSRQLGYFCHLFRVPSPLTPPGSRSGSAAPVRHKKTSKYLDTFGYLYVYLWCTSTTIESLPGATQLLLVRSALSHRVVSAVPTALCPVLLIGTSAGGLGGGGSVGLGGLTALRERPFAKAGWKQSSPTLVPSMAKLHSRLHVHQLGEAGEAAAASSKIKIIFACDVLFACKPSRGMVFVPAAGSDLGFTRVSVRARRRKERRPTYNSTPRPVTRHREFTGVSRPTRAGYSEAWKLEEQHNPIMPRYRSLTARHACERLRPPPNGPPTT